MLSQRFRACKVNINFPNFATVAVNLFQNFFVVALRDARNLCELLHADESAEAFAVFQNSGDGLLADPDDGAQGGGIRRVELHGLLGRVGPSFGEDDVGFEGRGYGVCDDVAGAQLLHVVDAACVAPADEDPGLTFRQRPDGLQITGRDGVDAERCGRQGIGDDASASELLRGNGVFAADADPGFECAVERVADSVAEGQVFGDSEDLACGAVFQQARGFEFRESQRPQFFVLDGIGIEGPHDDAVDSGTAFEFGFDLPGRLGIGFRADQQKCRDHKTGQRQEDRHGADFTFGEEPGHFFQGLFGCVFDGFFYGSPAEQGFTGLGFGESGALGDHAGAAGDEFVVRELHVDHAVSLDPSESDHHRRGEHVEHQFLGRSGLHARRSGDEFGSHDRFEGVFGRGCGGRSGVADHGGGQQPFLPGPSQPADDVGRGPRRGNPHERVVGRGPIGGQVAPGALRIVFGVLHGPAQGTVASGDESDHEVERNPEGRGKFRSIRHTEATAGSGADVEEPSAAAHAFDDALDELFHDRDDLIQWSIRQSLKPCPAYQSRIFVLNYSILLH